MWIDDAFPSLEFDITSDPTDEYNCIAWAAGDDTEWWSHLPGYKWPAERTPNVESLIAVFAHMGYELCESDEIEEGYEKVAIYAQGGRWKHAARQLPDARWTSKLGPDEDIEHREISGLIGNLYGEVHRIMRRRKT